MAAQQSADAGRRHRRLARGRAGLPRRRGGRRRRTVVAGAPRDVSDRRLRDDQLPDPPGSQADPLRRLERLLPESQGRQRRRPRGRGHSVRRRRVGGLARQGSAVAGQELRLHGADQRAPIGPVFQPCAKGFRGRDESFPAHRRGSGAPTADPDQRRLADRSDAQGADRAQRRPATAVDQRRSGRPHRRRRPSGGRAHRPRRHTVECRGAQGSPVGRRWFRAQRRDAAAIQRRPAQRRQVVDRQRRRHRRSAADRDATGRQDRPARRSMVVAFGFHRQRWDGRRVAGLGTSTARVPSTSTSPADDSATSRTPTSRSARRCTPTRRCPAG